MAEEILYAKNLSAQSGVQHAFFTKSWGYSFFSNTRTVQNEIPSCRRVADHFGISSDRMLFCQQIHSSTVVPVTDVWSLEDSPIADAMVTNMSNIALGILTADCVPVLLAASNMPIIGAAHAGWRGALGGVLENTLKAMEGLGAQRNNIQATLGPCIGQASYEVGPEFPSPFLSENTENKRFFISNTKKDNYLFDLSGYIVSKLLSLGVGKVEPMFLDTCADPDRFFSHRYSTMCGEKRKGSLISAILLR